MKLHDYLFGIGIAICISVLTAFTHAGYPCNYCRPAYVAPVTYKPPVYTTNSVQYIYTINYPQPIAQQGSTLYGLSEISGNYLAPFNQQALLELTTATAGRLGDHAQALLASNIQAITAAGASNAKVQEQALQVKAAEVVGGAIGRVVEQLKTNEARVTVTAPAAVAAAGATTATAEAVYLTKCLTCHSESAAEAKGNGSVLPGLSVLDREQKDLILDRIHRHGADRMPKGGSLTDEERRALEAALK